MTDTFSRPATPPDFGSPVAARTVDSRPLGAAPARPGHGHAEEIASPALPPASRIPEREMDPTLPETVEPPVALHDALWARPKMRSRLRLGMAFAFLVSLLFHSSLLTLFVGGTAPGLPDGQEAISVDIITQEELDILLGNGSSKGGKPPEVADADNGQDRSKQTSRPSAPQKTQSEAERKEAPSVIAAAESPEQMPVGSAQRINAASAETPPKSDRKSTTQEGSQNESKPSRRVDPKEKPDSEREDARIESEPDPLKPGADGGAMRRVAARGGVGNELGPLPPSMKQALMQQLQRQIELCYVPPAGTSGHAGLPLILIRLGKDGSLEDLPKSLRFDRSPAGKALVKAALKAVRQCAPYRMPPRFAPYYDDWKEIRAEFEFSSR